MLRNLRTLCFLVMLFGYPIYEVPSAWAGATSKTAQEAAEFVLRKFGKEAAEEGTEALAQRIERLALRHGDDAIRVVRRSGPLAMKALEEAGPHADDVVKLLVRHGDEALWIVAKPGRIAMFARYGDDAAEALIRHRLLAESLVEQFGHPAAQAMKSLGGQNARRLAMMAESQELQRLGRNEELLRLVGQYGDRAMDFVWRNKGSLAVSSVLIAFLADPEPFLAGTRQLGSEVIQAVGQPLAVSAEKTAEGIAKNTNWTAVLLVITGALLVVWLIRVRARAARQARLDK